MPMRTPPRSTTSHDLVLLLSSSPLHIPDSDIISTPLHLRDPPPPPPHHEHHERVPPPQSPSLRSSCSSSSLPSPSLLFKRPAPGLQSGLRSGSRAARIPDGVAVGFASAGALVRERVLSLDEEVVAEGEEGEDADGGRKKKGGAKKAAEGKGRKKDGRGDNVAEAAEGEKQREITGVDRMESEDLKGNADAAMLQSGPAEKPERHGAVAKSNNAALIGNVPGVAASIEEPQTKPRGGGAVEKLQKRKAKGALDRTSATPADSVISLGTNRHGSVLDETVPETPTKPSKASDKKPPARKKAAGGPAAELADGTDSAKEPTPRNRQTTTRKRTKTVSNHLSPENLPDHAGPGSGVFVSVDEPAELLELSPALIRRRSWTPVEDTKSDPSKPIDLSGSPPEGVTKPSFTKLLDNFTYNGQRDSSAGVTAFRSESGEALTKRRRLEPVRKPKQPAEPPTVDTSEVPPEKAKKPGKAPKKKPRTITDLVVSAYRQAGPVETPDPQDLPNGPNVSSLFGPQADSTSGAVRPNDPQAEKPKGNARSKKPTKKGEGKPTKPAAKPKKAAKQVAEKLLSPESALLRMNRQDILFGTSSQLAREDSPTFVRDLQQAIRDSELLGSQTNNLETLHRKPAVSGPGFTLVGRRTGLWAAASRDHEDGFLAPDDGQTRGPPEPNVSVDDSIEFLPECLDAPPSHTQALTAATYLEPDQRLSEEAKAALTEDSHEDGLPEAPSTGFCGPDELERFPSAQPVQPWSDYIDIDDFDRDHVASQRVPPSTFPTSNSPSRPSLTASRVALQQLGTRPNIPLLSQFTPDFSGELGKATYATKASTRSKKADPAAEKSPPKRPVGRPRKATTAKEATSQEAPAEQPESPSKRRPGRPRKATAIEEAASQEAPAELPDSPSKRRLGRPRKVDAAEEVASQKFPVAQPETPTKRSSGRPRKTAKSAEEDASQTAVVAEQESSPKRPVRRSRKATVSPTRSPKRKARSTPTAAASTAPRKRTKKADPETEDEWPDIDDIEDSQEEISPSPPRRGQGATARSELTLTSSQAESSKEDPFEGPTVLAPKGVERIGTGTIPRYYLEPVLARITAAVKSCPPSDDASQPSWLEKILLYDPIAVEGLAEWLRGQGIRIGVLLPGRESKRRRKKVNDPPGRKRMHDLPDWVVKRWCEDNSVCCMWKESMWRKKKKRKAKR